MSRVLPILFNTDMVRATMDGRKTVTRRCVKPQPTYNPNDGFSWKGHAYGTDLPPTVKGATYNFRCTAPCQPGNILYVRETWNYGYIETSDIPESCESWFEPAYSDCGDYIKALSRYFYKADENETGVDIGMFWRPSIHMPKEAARIWLKVTDVRVERLQDINQVDIMNEGVNTCKNCISKDLCLGLSNARICYLKNDFIKIWNSTIKKSDLDRYGWEANPWVWVIEFERCEKPEPCIIAGIEPAEDKRPCIGYGKSDIDDEPCEMCRKCSKCTGNDF